MAEETPREVFERFMNTRVNPGDRDSSPGPVACVIVFNKEIDVYAARVILDIISEAIESVDVREFDPADGVPVWHLRPPQENT